MSRRYTKVRTVGYADIGLEMGWGTTVTATRCDNLYWLLKPFRTSYHRYNADVIGVLQMLYGQVPVSTRADRDFLARYLKEIADDRRTAGNPDPSGTTRPPAGGTAAGRADATGDGGG